MQDKTRRREGFDYFVDKSNYDNGMPSQTIRSYDSYNDDYFNSNGNSFLPNQNNYEEKKYGYGNSNGNYGLEYPVQPMQQPMQPYSSAPQYHDNNSYYGNGFENNDYINNRRFGNNSFNKGIYENNRPDGTIEFSAFPGQGGLNPNERPLGDQTLMFSSSDLPASYNRNNSNNSLANRYVEQIIKTQQIQLNEQKREISKKFDNIDQALNNISKKVDNVNRTIASTTTLSFNNVDPTNANPFEEYDPNPYLDLNSRSPKKEETIEMTQNLKTSVLNDIRSDYENDVAKFKQQQIDLEKNKSNMTIDTPPVVKQEAKPAKKSDKSKQKKGLIIGLIVFFVLIAITIALIFIFGSRK